MSTEDDQGNFLITKLRLYSQILYHLYGTGKLA
jgi:hypothetical protein